MALREEITKPIKDSIAEFNRLYDGLSDSGIKLLDDMLTHVGQTRGKQLRPILLLLIAGAFDKVSDKAVRAALAIETLHITTLIHDDVVDESLLRRGKQTLNSIWGNKLAVLAGDYLYAKALNILVDINDNEILKTISSVAQEMGEGELLQQENALEYDLTEEKYYAGLYDFKYYAISHNGCIDSIQYKNFVSVYPSPKAKFTWNPETPTVLHPEVQFNNLTMPHNSDNIYYWKIQYDKDLTQSVTTLKEYEPLYTFRAFDDQSIAGEYKVQLVAMTKNLAPSGNYIVCSDTTDSRLVLVNDFLQFPNVITANGDGINDVFAIKNLIDGLGYPTNELSIFDRWGKRVYHKENISSEEDFWDPGAENIPAGTYFYRFVGKGYLGNIQRNGVIEVLR